MVEEESRVETSRTLVGVFEDEVSAGAALARLAEIGVSPEGAAVTRVAQDAPTVEELPVDPVKSGAATGAIIVGVVGTLFGWMLSTGAIGLPGIGTVEGAGPLTTTLAGLALGAIVGGLAGALMGVGIPRQVALPVAAPTTGQDKLYLSVTVPVLLIDTAEAALIANGAVEVQGTAADTALEHTSLRANMEDTGMEKDIADMGEGAQGRDPNTVTGTQDAIDPVTGALGTGGTPMTTGYGISGSTIGTGTAQGQMEHEEGVSGRGTPDAGAYDRGGRGSDDSTDSIEGVEHSQSTSEKYGPVAGEESSGDEKAGGSDLYTRGSSYGGEAEAAPDAADTGISRAEQYSPSSPETPPSYANVEGSQAQESAGTNIPGTEDPRGLGDNTDETEPRH